MHDLLGALYLPRHKASSKDEEGNNTTGYEAIYLCPSWDMEPYVQALGNKVSQEIDGCTPFQEDNKWYVNFKRAENKRPKLSSQHRI